MGHALDRVIREATVTRLAPFLADPAVREAKLRELGRVLGPDPNWEAEAARQTAEAARLRGKLTKVLARFGDDDDLADILAGQVATLKDQINAREDAGRALAGKLAAAQRATVAVDRVRGLLGPWPAGLLAGPAGPAAFEALAESDRELVVRAIGLRVVVAKSVPGQLAIQAWVFDKATGSRKTTCRLPVV